MIHPIKSIQTRLHSWELQHFDKTEYSKRLKGLKNKHENEICFIIGNGPSLQAEDLEKIANKSIVTFAFNRIYHIFPSTSWRPTYYISQDEKMLGGCVNEVNKYIISSKFIPIQMKWDYNINIENAYSFNIVHDENNGYPNFSTDISKRIVNAGTVVYSAFQLAFYMGIREMFLIGVDHHFQTCLNENGEIIVDPTVKDYFCDKYNEDKKKLIIPNPSKSTLTYISAKNHSELFGFKIYNATRGGKLEVFPRVDFDEVMKNL